MTADHHAPLAKIPTEKSSLRYLDEFVLGIPERGAVAADLHVVSTAGESLANVAPYLRNRSDKASFDFATASKRAFDIVGGTILGLVFLPLIIVAAIVIRSAGEPVIYKHRRVGRHGQVFECLKFRTMVPNAELVLRELLRQNPELRQEWLRNHKLRNDPRITAIGRFLRKTSLDELPQLWNVLRGDMSLVGPRPVTPDELSRYGRSVGVYLAERPGLTGLWQVTRCSDTTYRRRVAMDVYYNRHRDLVLDVFILAATVSVIFGKGDGAY